VRKLYSGRSLVRVLLIDSCGPEAAVLVELLERSRFRVTVATSAQDMQAIGVFEVIALAARAPLDERIQHCRGWRERGYLGAILAGCNHVAEGEALLDAGADDFITFPFEPVEFATRLRASIRRLHRLRCGPIELDRVERKARLRGRSLALTAREFELLARLMEARGQIVSRPALRKQVWRSPEGPRSNLVEVYLSRLRDKLGDDAILIETVRGAGYRVRR
jgi:DNA-binding response OmpR family regulator